MFLEEKQCG